MWKGKPSLPLKLDKATTFWGWFVFVNLENISGILQPIIPYLKNRQDGDFYDKKNVN